MSFTAQTLYSKYSTNISDMIKTIQMKKESAVPDIIATISTSILPSMMADLGDIKTLTGSEKKQLILDAIKLLVDNGFIELNKLPDIRAASWDHTVHGYLDTLLPALVDLLIRVENNHITFNKKDKQSCCW